MILPRRLATLLLLAAAVPASSQAPTRQWEAQDATSRLLTVRSTDGVLVDCHDGWSTSCFRVVLRITPSTARTVDIGHIPVDRSRGATAFVGTGASCKENGARGLPDPRSWSSGDYSWGEPPFRVTPARAATLLLNFGCDGRLAPGDEVTVQFDLAVDPDERQILTARYSVGGLKLLRMPGLSSR